MKYINTAEFYLGAVSSIDSPVTIASSNSAIATIGNNKRRIFGKGTSSITSSAVGNESYDATTNSQQLNVRCSCAI